MHQTDQVPDSKQDTMKKLFLNDLLFVQDNRHLEECLLKHVPTGFQPQTVVVWPSGDAVEKHYYPILAEYMNKTHEEAQRAYSASDNANRPHSSMDSLFTQHFQWAVYDKQADSDSGTRLKPDLMGAILENLPDGEVLGKRVKMSWEHAASIAEVKGEWWDLLTQTATYARQILAHQPHRVAVRCVMMNYRSRAATIVEFDRAGSYATRWHDLETSGGVAQFSKLLAGMYCAPNEASGFSRRFQCEPVEGGIVLRALFKGTWYYVREFLCNRAGLWGRCTRALLLQKEPVILDKDHYYSLDEYIPSEDSRKRHPVGQRPQEEEASSKKVSLPTPRSNCALLITDE